MGVVCFGFALRYASPALDAISCSVPVSRLREGREEEIIAGMEHCRLAIEQMAPVDLTSPVGFTAT